MSAVTITVFLKHSRLKVTTKVGRILGRKRKWYHTLPVSQWHLVLNTTRRSDSQHQTKANRISSQMHSTESGENSRCSWIDKRNVDKDGVCYVLLVKYPHRLTRLNWVPAGAHCFGWLRNLREVAHPEGGRSAGVGLERPLRRPDSCHLCFLTVNTYEQPLQAPAIVPSSPQWTASPKL